MRARSHWIPHTALMKKGAESLNSVGVGSWQPAEEGSYQGSIRLDDGLKDGWASAASDLLRRNLRKGELRTLPAANTERPVITHSVAFA